MSGIFSSMNTATKGLMASQTALHTTGHNISNVNTPGYTRQRVDMQADKAFSYTGVGQLGTGVKMSAVVRMIDKHVSKQIRTENSSLERFTEKSDVINQLEVIFNEPSDTALSNNISDVFKAFQNLSENPGDLNYKTAAVEQLKTLTDALNHMGKQIDGLTTETHEQIGQNVDDFNSKVEQLDMLNKQIFNISIKGQIPNDLLDQRDVLLKDLSAIGEVDTKLDDHGRVSIKMDSQDILTKEGTQNKLKYDEDDVEIRLTNKAGVAITETVEVEDGSEVEVPITIDVINGKILGNMDAIVDVKKAEKNLDDLANTIGKAVNKVHGEIKAKAKDGDDPEKVEKGFIGIGEIFTFGDDENGTALNININKKLLEDNNHLQGGEHPVGHEDYSQEDNSTALELAGLENIKIAFDGDEIVMEKDKDGKDTTKIKNDPSGNTIGGKYGDIIVKIGVSKQHSDNMVDNQMSLTNQLEMRRESVSGVSINDEVTNIIKFQAAYEANAKMISVLTDMLDVLINRTGV